MYSIFKNNLLKYINDTFTTRLKPKKYLKSNVINIKYLKILIYIKRGLYQICIQKLTDPNSHGADS